MATSMWQDAILLGCSLRMARMLMDLPLSNPKCKVKISLPNPSLLKKEVKLFQSERKTQRPPLKIQSVQIEKLVFSINFATQISFDSNLQTQT